MNEQIKELALQAGVDMSLGEHWSFFIEELEAFAKLVAEKAIKEALAQPEQETNKNGSPCPEFWDWLPKAYNFEGDGNFTKYNMEVAFLAGKEALAQPALMIYHDQICYKSQADDQSFGFWCPVPQDLPFPELPFPEGTKFYTSPPKRTWVGLTQDELNMIGDSMRTWNSWTITDVYFAIEAKLKEKNT